MPQAVNKSGQLTSGGLGLFGYVLLYIPYVLAQLLAVAPGWSYLVAWLGSWYIFWLVFSGKIKPLPSDRPLHQQIFRPIILIQLIFVGYNCLTSIFYFMDLSGYYYLDFAQYRAADDATISLAAQAQRYYLLAHAALVTGMLWVMDYRRSGEWQIQTSLSLPALLLVVSGAAFVVAQGISLVSGLGQIEGRLLTISLVGSVLALAVVLARRQTGYLAIASVIYGLNILAAFRSGWKEEVLVMVILLAAFTYPYYRKTVLLLGPLVIGGLLIILPAYANTVRSLSWSGDMTGEEAAPIAMREILDGNVDLLSTNWTFFTGRFSEIGLFTKYLEVVPEQNDFYGGQLARQSVETLVPRVAWPEKPNTELLVMERVYESNVVSRTSGVSAKPQYIVDGFLSAGAFGVFLACLFYGIVAGVASRKAEQLFGGYMLGSGLVFISLFQILWRGNSFEFLFNNVFWGFVIMIGLFLALRLLGVARRPEYDFVRRSGETKDAATPTFATS